MKFLDFLFGNWRTWRRLRGGRWTYWFHAPSMYAGWSRDYTLIGSEVEMNAEDYRGPRARMLP